MGKADRGASLLCLFRDTSAMSAHEFVNENYDWATRDVGIRNGAHWEDVGQAKAEDRCCGCAVSAGRKRAMRRERLLIRECKIFHLSKAECH